MGEHSGTFEGAVCCEVGWKRETLQGEKSCTVSPCRLGIREAKASNHRQPWSERKFLVT